MYLRRNVQIYDGIVGARAITHVSPFLPLGGATSNIYIGGRIKAVFWSKLTVHLGFSSIVCPRSAAPLTVTCTCARLLAASSASYLRAGDRRNYPAENMSVTARHVDVIQKGTWSC
jgi:hypothetical protein